MLHSQLPSCKQEHYEVLLKRFVYLLFGVFLLSASACNNSNSQNAEPSTDSTKTPVDKSTATAPIKNIDTKLYVLYLKNFMNDPADTVNNELQRLFAKHPGGDNKIFFQLYKPTDETLSLAAFNGTKDKGLTNYDSPPIVLTRTDALPDSNYEMAGKNVFLGSWEISKKDSNFRKLQDLINDRSKYDTLKKYILFTPELKKIEGSNNYNIVYHVTYDSVISKPSNNKFASSYIFANPSPPRQAY